MIIVMINKSSIIYDNSYDLLRRLFVIVFMSKLSKFSNFIVVFQIIILVIVFARDIYQIFFISLNISYVLKYIILYIFTYQYYNISIIIHIEVN